MTQAPALSTRLALKEGEKLTLKIGHGDRRERSPQEPLKVRSPSFNAGAIAIKPPSTRLSRESSKNAERNLFNEEDWGDFVASS